MRNSTLVLVLGFAVCAAAKVTPVTVSEADQTFSKAYTHLRMVLRLPASRFKPSQEKSSLTRDLLIERLFHLFEYVHPRIQIRVKPVNGDIKGLAPGLSARRSGQLKQLVNFGLVPPESLVVKSAQNQYSPQELGTILGVYLARTMDVTHELDPKYSPELMPE